MHAGELKGGEAGARGECGGVGEGRTQCLPWAGPGSLAGLCHSQGPERAESRQGTALAQEEEAGRESRGRAAGQGSRGSQGRGILLPAGAGRAAGTREALRGVKHHQV